MNYRRNEIVGIYTITNPSGSVYVGQSWNMVQRWVNHNSTSTFCLAVKRSMMKYGYDNHNFKIAHELPKDVTQQTMNVYEQVYMDLYKDAGVKLLNLRMAGSRGKHSEESKLKMSQKGKGKIISEEARYKMSLAKLGRKLSPETIEKCRLANIGKVISDEQKRQISIKNTGSKRTDETKLKMSLLKKGKPWTQARRDALKPVNS